MPTGFKTFAEVISFAVIREEEAYEFYIDLADKTNDMFMREIFTDFAVEESNHKKMLMELDLKSLERIYDNLLKKIDEIGVSKHLEDIRPEPDVDFKDLLVVAMKREEKSEQLYSILAEASADDDVSLLFVGLAKEEANHKLRIEKTYKQLFAG